MSLRVTISCLLTALVGVGKTIICDISDDSNQAMGMSAISISWGLGMTVGPLVSGKHSGPIHLMDLKTKIIRIHYYW